MVGGVQHCSSPPEGARQCSQNLAPLGQRCVQLSSLCIYWSAAEQLESQGVIQCIEIHCVLYQLKSTMNRWCRWLLIPLYLRSFCVRCPFVKQLKDGIAQWADLWAPTPRGPIAIPGPEWLKLMCRAAVVLFLGFCESPDFVFQQHFQFLGPGSCSWLPSPLVWFCLSCTTFWSCPSGQKP